MAAAAGFDARAALLPGRYDLVEYIPDAALPLARFVYADLCRKSFFFLPLPRGVPSKTGGGLPPPPLPASARR